MENGDQIIPLKDTRNNVRLFVAEPDSRGDSVGLVKIGESLGKGRYVIKKQASLMVNKFFPLFVITGIDTSRSGKNVHDPLIFGAICFTKSSSKEEKS